MSDPAEFVVCDNDLSLEQAERYAASSLLAIDTETMGLNPYRDRLCVVQLCDQHDHVTLVRIARGTRQAPRLQSVLESAQSEKIFHYARFDLTTLWHNLNIRVQPVFCTKIASKLARTYTDRHGLKDLVLDTCGVELNKTAQSSDWGAIHDLSTSQLAYAANDVRYLIPARDRLISMLQREERLHLAQACFAHLPFRVELDLLGYGDIFSHH